MFWIINKRCLKFIGDLKPENGSIYIYIYKVNELPQGIDLINIFRKVLWKKWINFYGKNEWSKNFYEFVY